MEIKKVLKVKRFSLTNKFEENFNKFTDENPDVKKIDYKKIDKYQIYVLVWYYVEK